MMALYVYALVPSAFDAPLGEGLVGEALRVVPVGPMAAVVGPVEDTPSIAPASLRRHDEVVRRVARASDAILPFRFGATVIDAAELVDGLAPRFDSLAAALERTRGCDQMTLRLYTGEPAKRGTVEVAAAKPPTAPPEAGPGARWLRERSAREASPPELARVRSALRSTVRAEAVETHDSPPLRASLFHLVERDRLPDYRAAVDAVAATLGPARVALTGPWPPYAFTELG